MKENHNTSHTTPNTQSKRVALITGITGQDGSYLADRKSVV